LVDGAVGALLVPVVAIQGAVAREDAVKLAPILQGDTIIEILSMIKKNNLIKTARKV